MNGVCIGRKKMGRSALAFVVAELSANHDQSFEQAVRIIEAAKEARADAVKLQLHRRCCPHRRAILILNAGQRTRAR